MIKYFRKSSSAQHCIIRLKEKWKQCLDQSLVFGVLLTNHLKSCDCHSHELLGTKLNAYGLETSAVRLIFDYLTNRKQRTKIGCRYSSGKELHFGVPQGSSLGPLLFTLYLFDLLLLASNIGMVSYADDTTLFTFGENINSTIESLEKASDLKFQWFCENHIKAKENKCRVFLPTNKNVLVNNRTTQIQNTSFEKLLGVKIDCKLNFKDHVGCICKKVSAKLNALTRVSGYMNPDRKG